MKSHYPKALFGSSVLGERGREGRGREDLWGDKPLFGSLKKNKERF